MKTPESPLGLHRVRDEAPVLPQAAARLDASGPCGASEMEVRVTMLHVDASSLRQLREAHGPDPATVRQALAEIVATRGKLHNPVTNSGGMLTGRASVVGAEFPAGPAPGMRIATLASLSLTPLRLDAIGDIAPRSNSIAVDGTAYVFARSPWAVLPDDIPEPVALAALDVAGAPARVQARVREHGARRVLVVGAGNSGTLAAIAAVEAGAAEVVVTDVDDARLGRFAALGISRTEVLQADATDAVDFAARVGAPADLTVSCVDKPGVEPACILATSATGHILYFSMTTSFTRATLCAEGVGSGATLEMGNGYMPGHAELAFGLLRRHRDLWPLLSAG